MPTNYPNGTDKFSEPSSPETIPLAQPGYQEGLDLSDPTNPPRNHYQHHVDLGDAVEALELNAAQVTHDHSGSTTNTKKGAKLKWENTHQSASPAASLAEAQALADTDDSALAIHHTLGTGPFQAAPGNHTHDYDGGSILNAPFIRCTSTSRPEPSDGLNIYETDTKRMRVWGDFGQGNGARWNILPTANIPIVRLIQTEAQSLLNPDGNFIRWAKPQDEAEDTFGFFNPGSTDASKQNLTITEPGVYQFDVAVQWVPGILPEMATVVVCRNGAETGLRYARIQAPSILSILGLPGGARSQTIQVSGKLRLSYNDVVSIKCKYGIGGIVGIIPTALNTYLDLDSKVRSRLDMHYVGP